MSTTFYILGGDTRQYWAALRLKAGGANVLPYGVPRLEDIPLPPNFNTDDHIVLPFPSFQGDVLRGSSALRVAEILKRIVSGTQIYGGLFGSWQSVFEFQGAIVHDLYDSEPFTTANAVPTAEGALQLAMEHSNITLHNSHCLVIGFGRIGKTLAQKLHALSADVTVCARKTSDCAMAEAMGMHSDETGIYRGGLHQYDFIFNTVPAPILDAAQLDTVSPDCLLIELASSPGGIPADLCRSRGLSYYSAPGLPGICAPATAGALYADCILKVR